MSKPLVPVLTVLIALVTAAASESCGRFAASDCAATATCKDDDAGAAHLCSSTPFTAAAIDMGTICGVGACRRIAGSDCAPDGGNVCDDVFPKEICGNGEDDDCDGVIDNGCAGESNDGGSAGVICKTCAVGAHAKLAGDGTPQGVVGDYNDFFRTTDCINTALCSLPGPAWVHNLGGPGTTCTSFCKSIGATCKPQCATELGGGGGLCDALATTANQGGKLFGCYGADYGCMEVNSAGQKTTIPDTGDCNFIPKNSGHGPQSTNVFNVECCCAF